MTNVPFSIGQKVAIRPYFVSSYGFNRKVWLTPERSYVGKIVDIDTEYSLYYPDVTIETITGERVNACLCHVQEFKPVPVASLSPQCRQLYQDMLRGHVTQRTALMDHGIMALPRRIADLKEAGYPVERVMKRNPHTGQRYASYYFA